MKFKILFSIILFLLIYLSCEKDKDESGNNAPVLSAIGNKTIAEGATVYVELSATDADGDTLAFGVATNPGFLSITGSSQTGGTATATLVIQAGDIAKGNYNAIIQVSDGHGGNDAESFTIIISEPTLADYFPINKGDGRYYKVTFPADCRINYQPKIEYPSALISTSITHGYGSWDAGQVNLLILISDIYETTSAATTWNIIEDETALNFYFYQNYSATVDCRLRLTIDGEDAKLEIIAALSGGSIIISRKVAELSSDDLTQKYDISVPAGDFTNCVKSDITFGEYPIEIYLAPGTGIVKAIGRDDDDELLYTLELSGYQNNTNSNDICQTSSTPCGIYTFCCTDSLCTEAYLMYNGTRYDCDGSDCDQALEDITNDMCGGTDPQANKLTDYDGNEYDTVVIGSQIWMAENLKSTHYSSGTAISGVYDHPDGSDTYGRLYEWGAAMNNVTTESPQGACPTGWHIPSQADFNELVVYLGGEDVAGGKLKSTGTLSGGDGLWTSPNTGATNESGFTALPAGWNLYAIGLTANFWSSTLFDANNSYRIELDNDYAGINKLGDTGGNDGAISVRCIKD